MNLTWSNRVIKYVLFVFNFLLVISGIIMIAVGVSVKSYYTDYDIFLNNSYFSLPNLLIAIGSLIFFISIFGCCGALRESWFLIFIFSILLSIIFIMELSAGIAGYVLRDKTSSFLTDELRESMKEYKFNSKDPNPKTIMWDTIQYEFECCGVEGPKDWTNAPSDETTAVTISDSTSTTSVTPTTTIFTTSVTPTTAIITTSPTTNSTNAAPATSPYTKDTMNKMVSIKEKWDLPASCCRSKPGATGQINCNLNDNSTTEHYNKGCVEGFGDYLKDHAVTLGGVGIAIALIQLFGVIFACHLTKQLKHGFYST